MSDIKAIKKFYERRSTRLKKRGASRFDGKYLGWLPGAVKDAGGDPKGMDIGEMFDYLEAHRNKKNGKNQNNSANNRNQKTKGNDWNNKKERLEFRGSVKNKGNNNGNNSKNNNGNNNQKVVGGYERKNNFKNGYGSTKVSAEDRATRAGRTTRMHSDKDGNWTPEREALHSKIIDDTFEGVKKPEGRAPVCTFLGGGPASGKSFVANNPPDGFDVPKSGKGTTAVKVDPDACKKPMPEYEEKDPEPVHEESSALAKRIMGIGLNEGYDVLVDGTGDGSADKMIKKIEQARAAGHTVNGRYVFMPVEDAIGLNAKRARSVDPKMLVKTHVTLAKIIPEIAPHFDDFVLTANVIGGKPKTIARCKRGGKLEIVDKDLWNKVAETASYEYDPDRVADIVSRGNKK